MNSKSVIKKAIIYLSLIILSSTSSADILTDKIRLLEEKRMERLRITKSGEEIKPFVSDGCSGGLSTGWEYFAERFPGFAARFGENPPWESCCIQHDFAYWQGESSEGYDAREAADIALRRCVENTGLTPQKEPQQEASLALKVTANLMYQAVRLGGKPCTSLPWRWGYGCPLCVNNTTKINDKDD